MRKRFYSGRGTLVLQSLLLLTAPLKIWAAEAHQSYKNECQVLLQSYNDSQNLSPSDRAKAAALEALMFLSFNHPAVEQAMAEDELAAKDQWLLLHLTSGFLLKPPYQKARLTRDSGHYYGNLRRSLTGPKDNSGRFYSLVDHVVQKTREGQYAKLGSPHKIFVAHALYKVMAKVWKDTAKGAVNRKALYPRLKIKTDLFQDTERRTDDTAISTDNFHALEAEDLISLGVLGLRMQDYSNDKAEADDEASQIRESFTTFVIENFPLILARRDELIHAGLNNREFLSYRLKYFTSSHSRRLDGKLVDTFGPSVDLYLRQQRLNPTRGVAAWPAKDFRAPAAELMSSESPPLLLARGLMELIDEALESLTPVPRLQITEAELGEITLSLSKLKDLQLRLHAAATEARTEGFKLSELHAVFGPYITDLLPKLESQVNEDPHSDRLKLIESGEALLLAANLSSANEVFELYVAEQKNWLRKLEVGNFAIRMYAHKVFEDGAETDSEAGAELVRLLRTLGDMTRIRLKPFPPE